jgi:hypothetical protein
MRGLDVLFAAYHPLAYSFWAYGKGNPVFVTFSLSGQQLIRFTTGVNLGHVLKGEGS